MFCCLCHTREYVCLIIFLEHTSMNEAIWSKATPTQKFDEDYQDALREVCMNFHTHQVQKKACYPPSSPKLNGDISLSVSWL